MIEQHATTALQEQKKVRRTLVGKVIADRMEKTVVVRVERTHLHPRLKKVIRTHKKYIVHDEEQRAHAGDVVKICEGRPKSKTKYMYLTEIIRSAVGLSGKGEAL